MDIKLKTKKMPRLEHLCPESSTKESLSLAETILQNAVQPSWDYYPYSVFSLYDFYLERFFFLSEINGLPRGCTLPVDPVSFCRLLCTMGADHLVGHSGRKLYSWSRENIAYLTLYDLSKITESLYVVGLIPIEQI